MKTRFPRLAKAGAILVFFALGLAWSAPVLADDEAKVVVPAAPAEAVRVRLPMLKVGEIKSGYVMMVSERGIEAAQPQALAQQQAKPVSPLAGLCVPR